VSADYLNVRMTFHNGRNCRVSQVFHLCELSNRIHMFFGLLDPDPDPLVRGMDPDSDPYPDQDPSIAKQK
jgi:hypothetical protein